MTHERKFGHTLVLVVGTVLLPGAVKALLATHTPTEAVQCRTTPSQDPRSIFESAQRALAAGDYKRAEDGFGEVLRLDPKSTAAYVNLGVVYMRTESFDAAIRALEAAKKLAPSLAGIDLNLGLAYYRKKDYSGAIRHFSPVLRV